jgi:aspartyl-tRNA(Asn)/glutamyl-tRNA(Gln) amidotransferase subunit A
MPAPEILRWGAGEIASAVRARTIRAQDALEACLSRIHETDGTVHAFLSVGEERAREAASRIDAAVADGLDPGPLAGVPIAIKDNIAMRGLPTTCGSRILDGFLPLFDATVVHRLEAAGAVLVGKTNMDEFAMGSSTENSAFGPTRNPWDLTCVPGGSSGGSAAAVAAGMVPCALGSDTGGSVRQPGGFCGLVALKPQYGRVSRWGLVAFASSLDQIGPMARDASDCALLWNAISGRDPRDATSLPEAPAVTAADLEADVRGLTLGLPAGWLGEGVDPEVRHAVQEAARGFERLGVTVDTVELPDPAYGIAVYYIIADAEASSNLARFDGVRYGRRITGESDLRALYEASRGAGFGTEVKRRILLGTFVLSAGYAEAYYGRARRVAADLERRTLEAMRGFDALLLPTSPTPAFRLGEKVGDPLAMYLSDVFTILANLLRLPALSFPGGVSGEGLPIGLQLYGTPQSEGTLLRLARAYEQSHDGAGSVRGGSGPVTRTLSLGRT